MNAIERKNRVISTERQTPTRSSVRVPSAPSAPQGTATALRITLLGALTVQIDGKPLPRLRTRHGYRLLALLVLRRGEPVERTFLAAALWPNHRRVFIEGHSVETYPALRDETHALASLRRCLSDLRHALGAAADRIDSPQSRTLRLCLRPTDTLDIDAFETLANSDHAAERIQAVTRYRGPLLEGYGDEWAVRERRRLENLYLGAVACRAPSGAGGVGPA